MIEINPDRLLADLRRLAEFGAYKTGVHRPTYSPQDLAARVWLVEQMRDAGLDAAMDGIGNILGRNTEARRKLLVGSHSDSQNHAGWLDGALGVIYGLEIARACRETDSDAGVGVDAVVWADEEAHFDAFLGSRSGIGLLSENALDLVTNKSTGQHLRDALRDAGLEGVPRRTINQSEYRGYVEAHIEQGDYLDAHDFSIGVVTSIVGINQYRVTFQGTRNHAGTTRMAIRRDAAASLIELAAAINARFRLEAAERTVWTVGVITIDPGQVSIIPDHASMMLQLRDEDSGVMDRMETILYQMVADANGPGRCSVSIERLASTRPHRMDAIIQNALDGAAGDLAPGRHLRMPSGAGHDAQVLATVMPSGMLFVPSIGGISHHWDENTRDADIVLGCQVMARACDTLLRAP